MAAVLGLLLVALPSRAATNAPPPIWPDKPLTLADCLNLAEMQNGTVLGAKKDLEASEGVVIQTRAILLPKLQATGDFTVVDESSLELLKTPLGSGSQLLRLNRKALDTSYNEISGGIWDMLGNLVQKWANQKAPGQA